MESGNWIIIIISGVNNCAVEVAARNVKVFNATLKLLKFLSRGIKLRSEVRINLYMYVYILVGSDNRCCWECSMLNRSMEWSKQMLAEFWNSHHIRTTRFESWILWSRNTYRNKFSRSWILIDDKICDLILYFEKKEIRGDILADFVATRFHRWNIMPKKFNSRNDAARRLLKWCHLLSETACTEQRGG